MHDTLKKLHIFRNYCEIFATRNDDELILHYKRIFHSILSEEKRLEGENTETTTQNAAFLFDCATELFVLSINERERKK